MSRSYIWMLQQHNGPWLCSIDLVEPSELRKFRRPDCPVLRIVRAQVQERMVPRPGRYRRLESRLSQVPLLFHGHRNDAVNHGPFVAPGAEGRVSADHGKAAAKLGHKARGVLQLLLGEDFLRDIAVDDHVVFEQFLHGLREPMDRMLDAVDLVSAFRIDEGHLRVQRRRAAELLAIKGLYEDAGSGFNRVF